MNTAGGGERLSEFNELLTFHNFPGKYSVVARD